MRELVSIVMPVYNGEKYLVETLNSVLAQTYSDWELLITNDGSKDKSEEILSLFSEKDKRIKFWNQKNGGSAKARNNSLKNSLGKYIVFLDSDDLWDKKFLEKQILFLKEKKAKIVSGSYRRINEEGEEILNPFIVPKETNYKKMLKSCTMSCLTSIYDSELIKKEFFKEELGSYRDDYVMWLSMLKNGEKVYGNPEVLASYRVFKGSVTGNKWKILKPHFNVYYREEKLGIIKSLYYFVAWIIISLKKY